MRLFCSLMALLILLLNCIPCSDGEGFATEQKNHCSATVKSAAAHSGGAEQEHEDLCSPFCQCSCCAVAYALPSIPVPELRARTVFSEQVFASYLQQVPSGISLPIWQPPQLA